MFCFISLLVTTICFQDHGSVQTMIFYSKTDSPLFKEKENVNLRELGLCKLQINILIGSYKISIK